MDDFIEAIKTIAPLLSAIVTLFLLPLFKMAKRYIDDLFKDLRDYIDKKDVEVKEDLKAYVVDKSETSASNVHHEVREEFFKRFDRLEEIRKASLQSVYKRIDNIDKRTIRLELLNDEKDRVIQKIEDSLLRVDKKLESFDEKLLRIIKNTSRSKPKSNYSDD